MRWQGILEAPRQNPRRYESPRRVCTTIVIQGNLSAVTSEQAPTAEANKALVLRFLDAFEAGDIAGAAACFDPSKYYSHAYEADLAGTWAQQKANFRAGTWTDVDVERVAVLADGDRVAYQAKFTGTHRGEFLGIPASGQRVTIPMLEIWRVEDGLIVEHWGGFQITEALIDRLRRGGGRA